MPCCFRPQEKVKGNSTRNSIVLQGGNGEERTTTLTVSVLPGCDRVRFLGEGSFGVVILVRERSTGVLFAAKIMNKAQLMAENQFSNIITERRVLREAGPHPFVIECHSGFQTENAVVLVLEYLSGGDMYDLLKKNGCLTEQQARFYIAEVLVGLHELHRLNFVFRDLKLENILIDDRGHIRLTDFGLAGQVDPVRGSENSITDISGTAIYQAPEILSRSGHGRLVDYWALGVLTHAILTGRPPFSADGGHEELYNRIQSQDVDLNHERLQGVSAEARDFMRQLLQRNPSDRLGAADDDQASIRAHPFLRGIDWDAILRYDLDPPLPPPRQPEAEVQSIAKKADIAFVEKKIFEKLYGNMTCESNVRFKFKQRNRQDCSRLDAREYKLVNVRSRNTTTSRVSIGLDFQGTCVDAPGKTWTGTTDDFGRFISPSANTL